MPKARRPAKTRTEPAVKTRNTSYWVVAFAFAGVVTFLAYGPALDGPFLFDDAYLLFFSPESAEMPFTHWLSGVRPLLNATYWVNYQLSGQDAVSYHVFNVIIHLASALLLFLVLRRILEWTGTPEWPRRALSLFGAGLFLLHPLQTESVAYVAGRSEAQSALLLLSAYAVFLYRKQAAITWSTALAVLALFGAAVLSKEHAAVFPALLLLTDYYWNPGFSLSGARRNWRLYAPAAALGAVGLVYVWKVLGQAQTAGFAMRELPWNHYFYTQWRAIWVYVRMFFLPYGQSADHDFAISRSPLDHGAIVGLLALIGMAAAAWLLRRRYPLASFGILIFLVLLAPTSSVVPIKDPLAERRLYLPMLGLVLVCAEPLRRINLRRPAAMATLAAVVFVCGVLTYQRNQVWTSPLALWADTAAKSPNNPRAHFHLAFTHYQAGNCPEAVKGFERAAALEPPDHRLLVDWGLALECAGQPRQALEKLQLAAGLQRTAHVYTQIGMIRGKQGDYPGALEALETAASIDANYAMTYVYRGNVRAAMGDEARALEDFQRAVRLDPKSDVARQSLMRAQQRQGQRR